MLLSKELFTSGLTSGDEVVSSSIVKQRIKALIENEDQCRPLSDLSISKTLVNEGIIMARRTVAKYREEMNIPPSSKRKKFK